MRMGAEWVACPPPEHWAQPVAQTSGVSARTSRQLIIHVQIEEKGALDDLEAIAATAGIDVCGLVQNDPARSAELAAWGVETVISDRFDLLLHTPVAG